MLFTTTPSEKNGHRMDEKSYNLAFDIYKDSSAPSKKQSMAFAQASDIRKFEIEMYWKRATYFWAIIAVTFAGYFALSTAASTPLKNIYLLLISSMGVVFTYSWYLVNRGSKYWQENWENHLDLLEDEITGPLYKTVLERPNSRARKDFNDCIDKVVTGPSKQSVSKINQWVAIYILSIWICMAFANAILIFITRPVYHELAFKVMAVIIIFALMLLAMCAMKKIGVTHTGKHLTQIHSRKTKIVKHKKQEKAHR